MNQQHKARLWEYWQGMNRGGHAEFVSQALHSDVVWHGFQPLRHLNGSAAVWSRFWHPHMVWHGSFGIGSAYGLDEFKRNAQGPIVRAFPDRRGSATRRASLRDGSLPPQAGPAWPAPTNKSI